MSSVEGRGFCLFLIARRQGWLRWHLVQEGETCPGMPTHNGTRMLPGKGGALPADLESGDKPIACLPICLACLSISGYTQLSRRAGGPGFLEEEKGKRLETGVPLSQEGKAGGLSSSPSPSSTTTNADGSCSSKLSSLEHCSAHQQQCAMLGSKDGLLAPMSWPSSIWGGGRDSSLASR